MHWKIEWREDGHGLAAHGATGAAFHVSRTGWIAASEAAQLSEQTLAELVTELRTLLEQVSATTAPGSTRIH